MFLNLCMTIAADPDDNHPVIVEIGRDGLESVDRLIRMTIDTLSCLEQRGIGFTRIDDGADDD